IRAVFVGVVKGIGDAYHLPCLSPDADEASDWRDHQRVNGGDHALAVVKLNDVVHAARLPYTSAYSRARSRIDPPRLMQNPSSSSERYRSAHDSHMNFGGIGTSSP